MNFSWSTSYLSSMDQLVQWPRPSTFHSPRQEESQRREGSGERENQATGEGGWEEMARGRRKSQEVKITDISQIVNLVCPPIFKWDAMFSLIFHICPWIQIGSGGLPEPAGRGSTSVWRWSYAFRGSAWRGEIRWLDWQRMSPHFLIPQCFSTQFNWFTMFWNCPGAEAQNTSWGKSKWATGCHAERNRGTSEAEISRTSGKLLLHKIFSTMCNPLCCMEIPLFTESFDPSYDVYHGPYFPSFCYHFQTACISLIFYMIISYLWHWVASSWVYEVDLSYRAIRKMHAVVQFLILNPVLLWVPCGLIILSQISLHLR